MTESGVDVSRRSLDMGEVAGRFRFSYARFRSGSRVIPVCLVKVSQRASYAFGSGHMRTAQLVQLLSPHLDPRYRLRASSFRKGSFTHGFRKWLAMLPRDSVVILVKQAIGQLSEDGLEAVARKTLAIGFDWVDQGLGYKPNPRVAFHLLASHAGCRAMNALIDELHPAHLPRPVVGLLLHHSDPRLAGLPAPPRDRLRTLYLGSARNIALPEDLSDRVDRIYVHHIPDMEKALPALPAYNLHYGVRPNGYGSELRRSYKPFTKGYTAAACGANIIVNREVDDAVISLGDDYPYLVDGDGEVAIRAAFDLAEQTLGGPIWSQALDRMAAMHAEVRVERLAAQLGAALDAALA